MPASLIIRHSESACPACAEWRCADPAECLYYLTVHPWSDCDRCDGTGWADESDAGIFCRHCDGSGLVEYTERSIVGHAPSERARAQLAAHVERLRALVGSVAVAA